MASRRTWWLIGSIWFVVCIVCCPSVRGTTRNAFPVPPAHRHVPDSVLDKMFHFASIYEDIVTDYWADLYLKGHFRIHRQNRLIRFIPSMFRFEKGVNDYMYESISQFHYTAPQLYERKIRAVSTTFSSDYSQFFDIFDYIRFNLYSSSMMEDRFLSPFSARSKSFYYYELDSVIYRDAGVYVIKVTPRFKSTQLLSGRFWLSSDDWTIRYIDLKGTYDLIKFHIRMFMGDADEKRYLPVFMNLDIVFNFLRNDLEMNYTGWFHYNDITLAGQKEGERRKRRKKKDRYNVSRSYILTCDTAQLIKDRKLFSGMRPIPLSHREDSLYKAFDQRRAKDLGDTIPKKQTKLKKNLVYLGQLGDALISSYNVDISKIGSINCSPLINPLLISYSHRNGISYKQEFKYNKLFHDGRLLRITPQIGYNFTRKELYASADCEYIYNPRKHGSIVLSAGNGNRIYSSIVLDQLQSMPDSLLNFDNLELDYFKDIYLNVAHNIEIVNGLNLWTGLSMHWRYTKSTPEVEARVRSHYNSFAPRIRVEWTPGMYYYMNNNRKVNVGSKYPTFVVDYERGIKILDSSGKYERIEFSAEQKIRFNEIHTLAYHVGGGFFTNQEDLFFVDYVDFANRNLPQGWNDDIGGTFQLLDSRWYNASRHYFRGNVFFETPFLLLYPVSRLMSFVQKERLYGGLLFMPHLNPYVELGYGIGTHIFDFGVFIGNEKGKFTTVGCKFTFELFNR